MKRLRFSDVEEIFKNSKPNKSQPQEWTTAQEVIAQKSR